MKRQKKKKNQQLRAENQIFMWREGCGMGQLVKLLLCKFHDPAVIPRTHRKVDRENLEPKGPEAGIRSEN